MKIKPVFIICLFFVIVLIYVITGCPDNSNVTPDPTPTPGTDIPETLYIKGNLFDEDGTETFGGYKVTCSPPVGQVQTVTTNTDGLYEFTVPGGAQRLPFEVRDEDDILKGTFEISVEDDGSLNVADGISISGIGFNTTIPSIRTEETSGPGIPQSYSNIPAGTSSYKAAILEVVHRSVIERLVKAGRRLGIYGPTDKYTTILDGPGGGSVIYTILADETNVTNQHYAPDNPSGQSPDLYYHYIDQDYKDYPAPTSDPGIFRDRIHLFRFYDYAENGLKVKGNVAFVYGYEDYPSSYNAYIYSTALDAWSNHVGWWGDPAKGNEPAWAHYTLVQEMIDYMTFVAGTAGTEWKANIWDQYQDVVSLKYWIAYTGYPVVIVPALNFEIVNNLKIKDAGNDDEIDRVTVSFDILNQKTAIAKLGLSANEAALQYQWRDELEFFYHFASDGPDPSDDVLISELTGPGIYKRTYSDLMDALMALPKTPGNTQMYTIDGPQGGNAVFTAAKALVPGSDPVRYNVIQTHTFNNYAANDIVLSGEYSYIYETDDTGQYTKEVTTPGTVEITGFFHSTARHRFIIWWNGSSYQLTNWFFVDDYADAWQRTTVILPVSFDSR